jgi:hypothetical protein
LSTREEPDDLERCGRPLSKNDSPAIAKNHVLGLNEEDQAVFPGGIADPVLYEPRFNETLSQGSTSLIARMKPGVVVKCPRYSWWHSETADAHPFVKDTKRSFEVEERLLDILGAHPRIIRYVSQSQAVQCVNFHSTAAILVSQRSLVDYSSEKLAMVICKLTLTSIMMLLIYVFD